MISPEKSKMSSDANFNSKSKWKERRKRSETRVKSKKESAESSSGGREFLGKTEESAPRIFSLLWEKSTEQDPNSIR